MTRVLFIGGAGRSGTTLTERILARVPGTVALGEVMHLWARGIGENQLCGCGQPFLDCEFWNRVGERAFGGWSNVDPVEMVELKDSVDKARKIPSLLRDAPAIRSERARYADHFARLYRAAAETAGAGLVIDSSKQVSLPFVLRGHPDVNLAVLQVVRDPRAVANSWTRDVARPEITDDGVLMPKYRPAATALSWDVHNAGFDVLRSTGTPVIRLRYEDLMADPAREVARLSDRLGTTPPITLLGDLRQHRVNLEVDHTAAGNPIRFRTGSTRLRRDDAWEEDLPAGQRTLVTALTWPLMIKYHRARGAH